MEDVWIRVSLVAYTRAVNTKRSFYSSIFAVSATTLQLEVRNEIAWVLENDFIDLVKQFEIHNES